MTRLGTNQGRHPIKMNSQGLSRTVSSHADFVRRQFEALLQSTDRDEQEEMDIYGFVTKSLRTKHDIGTGLMVLPELGGESFEANTPFAFRETTRITGVDLVALTEPEEDSLGANTVFARKFLPTARASGIDLMVVDSGEETVAANTGSLFAYQVREPALGAYTSVGFVGRLYSCLRQWPGSGTGFPWRNYFASAQHDAAVEAELDRVLKSATYHEDREAYISDLEQFFLRRGRQGLLALNDQIRKSQRASAPLLDAIELLGRLDQSDSAMSRVSILSAALKSRDPAIRSASAEALLSLRPDAARVILRSHVSQETNRAIKRKIEQFA